MSALATMPTPTLTTLDPQLLATLDSLLRDELDSQRALLDDARATMRELTGAEGSDAAHQRDIAERSMNKALDVVAEIEHAIERISTETYGTCEGCDGAIPAARLEAIPYARSCVHCPPPPPLPRPV
jgi:RNA polymerase-binding transcription factor DksA